MIVERIQNETHQGYVLSNIGNVLNQFHQDYKQNINNCIDRKTTYVDLVIFECILITFLEQDDK